MIRRGEYAPFGLSFLYFFCLIGSYMMLRPVRETLAVRSGDAEWLFSSTFVVMLFIVPAFGWLVSRLRKRVFLPLTYLFFIANLLGFAAWLTVDPSSLWAGRVFFVWLSTYNLFVVSVFWSLMVDVFDPEQGKRLFGPIAAGGSLGGMVGPLVSILKVDAIGTGGLILVAAGLLAMTLLCQWRLLPRVERDARGRAPIGGSIWAGAQAVFRNPYLGGLAVILLFLPLLQTLLYFTQLELVGQAYGTDEARLKWFGAVDLGTQLIGLACQLVITSHLLRRAGPAWTLMIMPAITAVGFAALALAPGVLLLGVFQAVRRGGEYGLMKPARELLFTPLADEDKYKSKNFIDTAVYRGGDMSSGWAYRGLVDALGLSMVAVLALGAPLAALWAVVSFRMGRRFESGRLED